ncbi:MAG: glycerol dehydrogenase [Oscillospiraceae bacterium]|nr:glycerol dehydrogenase [Oscillospiraceae bacterium]
MSKRVIISPMKYVQGPGEMENLADYYKVLGSKKACIIASPSNIRNNKEKITASFEKGKIPYEIEKFGGECCKSEIDRLIALAKDADCIIGVGGGKVIDTAKAVAYYAKLPVIIAPTIASTDAPCSALTVLYKEDGTFEEYLLLPANPNCVLVDTAIVAKAPARLLVAGMGDALATYFEARAAVSTNSIAMAGGLTSISAMALAELCYETLLADGLKAKLSMEAGVSSRAVENIVEANTFLSGIGFESGGLGAAHSVHNGLTVLPDTHDVYHGEKVSFGVLTQLVLENADMDEITEVIDFCQSVGLATTFAQLGIKDPTPEKLMAVAKAATAPGETIHNMPFEVTADLVYSAMVVADKLGA